MFFFRSYSSSFFSLSFFRHFALSPTEDEGEGEVRGEERGGGRAGERGGEEGEGSY